VEIIDSKEYEYEPIFMNQLFLNKINYGETSYKTMYVHFKKLILMDCLNYIFKNICNKKIMQFYHNGFVRTIIYDLFNEIINKYKINSKTLCPDLNNLKNFFTTTKINTNCNFPSKIFFNTKYDFANEEKYRLEYGFFVKEYNHQRKTKCRLEDNEEFHTIINLVNEKLKIKDIMINQNMIEDLKTINVIEYKKKAKID